MRMHEVMPKDEAVEIGSYEFTAERIMEFARDFDPQFFHLDAERAKNSVFGGLCASGWHISAAMMKCNVAFIKAQAKALMAEGKIAAQAWPLARFQEPEMAEAGLCRRRGDLFGTLHPYPADTQQARPVLLRCGL